MKISIISGSHRNPSQSEKVARHIEQTLQAEHAGMETWLYSRAAHRLPLWYLPLWGNNPEWDDHLVALKMD